MKAVCFLIILGVCLAGSARADYILNLSSDGTTTRDVFTGTRVSLTASLQAQSGEMHNAAIFRLEFSSPGLVYESYAWPVPYDNQTLSDDSKPLARQLPATLSANTLAGIGYPEGIVDIELSNVVDSLDRFGSGPLVQMSFRIPDNQPLGALTITPIVDTFSNGFNLIPSQSGTALQLNILARPPLFNTAPILSAISNQTINENSSIQRLAFDASDNEQLAHELTLSAFSNNQNLVRSTNLSISSSGNRRFMTIIPEPNVFGSVNITVQVSDGQLSASRTFTLNILNVNDPPGIGAIAAQTLQEDQSRSIPLTLFDIDDLVEDLQLSFQSSNPTLFPPASIQYRSVPSPTLTLTPAPNQFGSATVEVIVSDGALQTQASFVVTVNAVNDPPRIVGLAALETQEDQSVQATFQIMDDETSANDLQLIVESLSPDRIASEDIVLTRLADGVQIQVVPLPNAFGEASIRIVVSDDVQGTELILPLNIVAVNDAPSLSSLPDQTLKANAFLLLPVFISDIDHPAETLEVVAQSSDEKIISNEGLTWSGTGSTRNLTLTPARIALGTTQITLIVTDPEGAEARSQFNVSVESSDIGTSIEFVDWQEELNLPEDQAEPTDDADGDGVPNVVEFAFRTDPLTPGNDGLPKSIPVQEGDNVVPGVTFTRNRLAPGLVIEVKAFTALGLGDPVELVEVVEVLDDATERVTLKPANPTPGTTTAMFFITIVRIQ